MSVQVRRRREAAAFLQSFVGAQGELLVDTTNNRVQVHDGTTPGGFPAAALRDLAGRNAGLNTNFAVNQRGYASGTALAAGAYGHDRHKAGAGGCTYSFAQAVPDTGVTITAGSLVQAIDGGNVHASSWWLTWSGTATARVWQGSASGAFSAGTPLTLDGVTVNALPVSGLTIGQIANVEFAAGTLGTTRPWQLEAALPNAGPTRYERRHGELALCQRYYQVFGGNSGSEYFTLGIFYSSSAAVVILPLKVTMRATPTVTFGPNSAFILSGVNNFVPTNIALYNATISVVGFGVNISGGASAGAAAFLQANYSTAATVACSAEI